MASELHKSASARVPRYTSYPTATHFSSDIDGTTGRRWLTELPPDEAVSLYLHVPFCRKICWYCACNMKLALREEPLVAYAADLIQHIELTASHLPVAMSLAHVHWGGGTPTSLRPELMSAIMGRVHDRFLLNPDAEVAVEVDPRTFRNGIEHDLAGIGTTRVSVGVQEFDRGVQKIINRIQPYAQVCNVVDRLRAVGVRGINFDLMYGLPGQTCSTISKTMQKVLTLQPDRIALFGYAHVPWMAKRQIKVSDDLLPNPQERLEQANMAADILVGAGYIRIGLDHFVRPDDGLYSAFKDHCLIRNFQGYSDDPARTILGIGSSAISSLPQGYCQNITETGAWSRCIAKDLLPVARGCILTPEDLVRRDIIMELMCYLQADVGLISRRHGWAEDKFDANVDACKAPPLDESVTIEGRRIKLHENARIMIRVIAQQFDQYNFSTNAHSSAV
ncbi:MAG: oxygen-independent coproporphyrinogen III oxidase [Pseudomonadota bacterium]